MRSVSSLQILQVAIPITGGATTIDEQVSTGDELSMFTKQEKSGKGLFCIDIFRTFARELLKAIINMITKAVT
jgi:hypothetical protein